MDYDEASDGTISGSPLVLVVDEGRVAGHRLGNELARQGHDVRLAASILEAIKILEGVNDEEDLARFRTLDSSPLPYRVAKECALEAFEERYFSALLARTRGNVSEAARQAGLDRSNFRRALRRAKIRASSNEDGERVLAPEPATPRPIVRAIGVAPREADEGMEAQKSSSDGAMLLSECVANR